MSAETRAVAPSHTDPPERLPERLPLITTLSASTVPSIVPPFPSVRLRALSVPVSTPSTYTSPSLVISPLTLRSAPRSDLSRETDIFIESPVHQELIGLPLQGGSDYRSAFPFGRNQNWGTSGGGETRN